VVLFANAASDMSCGTGANAACSAIKVFGQSNFVSLGSSSVTQSSMTQPGALAIDSSGNLYVADAYYNRVTVYANASSNASCGNGSNGACSAFKVIGQPNFTTSTSSTTASTFFSPQGVAVDSSGNLYVGDTGNARVLLFGNASSTGSCGSGSNG